MEEPFRANHKPTLIPLWRGWTDPRNWVSYVLEFPRGMRTSSVLRDGDIALALSHLLNKRSAIVTSLKLVMRTEGKQGLRPWKEGDRFRGYGSANCAYGQNNSAPVLSGSRLA